MRNNIDNRLKLEDYEKSPVYKENYEAKQLWYEGMPDYSGGIQEYKADMLTAEGLNNPYYAYEYSEAWHKAFMEAKQDMRVIPASHEDDGDNMLLTEEDAIRRLRYAQERIDYRYRRKGYFNPLSDAELNALYYNHKGNERVRQFLAAGRDDMDGSEWYSFAIHEQLRRVQRAWFLDNMMEKLDAYRDEHKEGDIPFYHGHRKHDHGYGWKTHFGAARITYGPPPDSEEEAKSTAKKKIDTTVDSDYFDIFTALAKDSCMSTSALLRSLIVAHVKKHKDDLPNTEARKKPGPKTSEEGYRIPTPERHKEVYATSLPWAERELYRWYGFTYHLDDPADRRAYLEGEWDALIQNAVDRKYIDPRDPGWITEAMYNNEEDFRNMPTLNEMLDGVKPQMSMEEVAAMRKPWKPWKPV